MKSLHRNPLGYSVYNEKSFNPVLTMKKNVNPYMQKKISKKPYHVLKFLKIKNYLYK